MFRKLISVAIFGYSACLLTGCAHFVESRSIEAFSKALQQSDLETLKKRSSPEFEHKALRNAKALQDFKILNLPDGNTSVVKVDEISKDKKRVTVEVGEKKRKLLYELIRDEETNKWVVDDIYMRQKRKGVTITKSVTEQMDLLLSVRDFLDSWSTGDDRDDVLDVTTEEFSRILGDLPPSFLAEISSRVVGEDVSTSSYRPEAQLDEDVAVVVLPRSTGKLILSYKLTNGLWKVQDVAVQSTAKEDHIGSVKKMASILQTALTFLERYELDDKPGLSKVCTKKFYQNSLVAADVSQVPLPQPIATSKDYQIDLQGDRAYFIVPGSDETLNMSLVQVGEDEIEQSDNYLVEEVTLYNADGTQQKRLSALFTSHAIMQIFSESLARRDLISLRQNSTPDFGKRVWRRLNEDALMAMPLNQIDDAQPKVVSSMFNGATTEITVTQGNSAMTYVLRDWNGQILVDDVLLPMTNRPNSLKQNLEYALRIYWFSESLRLSQIKQLQRLSSNDFNRLVWKQAKSIPDTGFDILRHLQSPIRAIRIEEESSEVVLGNDRWGAIVRFKKQSDVNVIDDITLIAGAEANQRTQMKNNMRLSLARSMRVLYSADSPPRLPNIQPVDFNEYEKTPKKIDIDPGLTAPASQIPVVAPESEAF